jgi:hypothetical protein
MRSYVLVSLTFTGSTLIACASTPGARPSDMSATQHEQAAAAHEAEATSHAEQYQPSAQTTKTTCGGKSGCWTSVTNPTEGHRGDAEKHRKIAADHRAASQTLRDAEAQACVGLSDDDRDMSPFYHREDIARVEPAIEHTTGKNAHDQAVGAVVVFRAVPGMTAEWLQRLVDCHVARNNALGNDVPEMPYCPLVPKGVTAKVSSTGDGFAVRIESRDPETAKEVLRRAQALKTAG